MTKVSPDQLEFSFKEKKRMNDLNSVLLEGELVNDPLFINSKSIFNLDVHRSGKTNIFKVICGGHLAEVCDEYLKTGRRVRAVGRLDTDESGLAYLLAEHVEFRPIRNTNEE